MATRSIMPASLSRTPSQSHWFLVPRPVRDPTLRLFCLPYVGGGASIYQRWSARLPPDIEVCAVQLPGRETRADEDPFDRIEPLLDALDLALAPYLDRPFALFGHSMGAILAFELAHLLGRRSHAPSHVLVSGRIAPHRMKPAGSYIHTLPEAEFLVHVEQLAGTPREVFSEPELRALVLPVLRADFSLIERWEYSRSEPMDVPITAFGGDLDSSVPPAELVQWSAHTRREFSLHLLPGDHFFLRGSEAALVERIARALDVGQRQ